MIEVREPQPGDAEAIATAHVEGWRVGYRGVVDDAFLDDPEFLRIRRARWVRRLENGPPPTGDVDNVIYSLLVDSEVVGFGHVGREAQPPPDTSGRGEIYAFYVRPEHWGTGASDELMSVCLPALRSRFSSAVLGRFATTRARVASTSATAGFVARATTSSSTHGRGRSCPDCRR